MKFARKRLLSLALAMLFMVALLPALSAVPVVAADEGGEFGPAAAFTGFAEGRDTITVNGLTAEVLQWNSTTTAVARTAGTGGTGTLPARSMRVRLSGTPTVRPTGFETRTTGGNTPGTGAYLIYARAGTGGPATGLAGTGADAFRRTIDAGPITNFTRVWTGATNTTGNTRATFPLPAGAVNETFDLTFPAAGFANSDVRLYIGMMSRPFRAVRASGDGGEGLPRSINFTNLLSIHGMSLSARWDRMTANAASFTYQLNGVNNANGTYRAWFHGSSTVEEGVNAGLVPDNTATTGRPATADPGSQTQDIIAWSRFAQDIPNLNLFRGDNVDLFGTWPTGTSRASRTFLRVEFVPPPALGGNQTQNNVTASFTGTLATGGAEAYLVNVPLASGTNGATATGTHIISIDRLPAGYVVEGGDLRRSFRVTAGETVSRDIRFTITNPAGITVTDLTNAANGIQINHTFVADVANIVLLDGGFITRDAEGEITSTPTNTPATAVGGMNLAADTNAIYNADADMLTINAYFGGATVGIPTDHRRVYTAEVVSRGEGDDNNFNAGDLEFLDARPVLIATANGAAINRNTRWVIPNFGIRNVAAMDLAIRITLEDIDTGVESVHEFNLDDAIENGVTASAGFSGFLSSGFAAISMVLDGAPANPGFFRLSVDGAGDDVIVRHFTSERVAELITNGTGIVFPIDFTPGIDADDDFFDDLAIRFQFFQDGTTAINEGSTVSGFSVDSSTVRGDGDSLLIDVNAVVSANVELNTNAILFAELVSPANAVLGSRLPLGTVNANTATAITNRPLRWTVDGVNPEVTAGYTIRIVYDALPTAATFPIGEDSAGDLTATANFNTLLSSGFGTADITLTGTATQGGFYRLTVTGGIGDTLEMFFPSDAFPTTQTIPVRFEYTPSETNQTAVADALNPSLDFFPDGEVARNTGSEAALSDLDVATSRVRGDGHANMITVNANITGPVDLPNNARLLANLISPTGIDLGERSLGSVEAGVPRNVNHSISWTIAAPSPVDWTTDLSGYTIRFSSVSTGSERNLAPRIVQGIEFSGMANLFPDGARTQVSAEINLADALTRPYPNTDVADPFRGSHQTGYFTVRIMNNGVEIGRTNPIFLLRNQVPTANHTQFVNFVADIPEDELEFPTLEVSFVLDGDFIYRIDFYQEDLVFGDRVQNGQHIQYFIVRDVGRFNPERFNPARARWLPTANGIVNITRSIPRPGRAPAGVILQYTGTCPDFIATYGVDGNGIITRFAFTPEGVNISGDTFSGTANQFNGGMIIIPARPNPAAGIDSRPSVREMARTFYNVAAQQFINTSGNTVEVLFGLDRTRRVHRIRNEGLTFIDELPPHTDTVNGTFDFAIDRVPRGAQGIVRIAAVEAEYAEGATDAERAAAHAAASFASANIRFRIPAPPRAPRSERTEIRAPRRDGQPYVITRIAPTMGFVFTRETTELATGNFRTAITWHNGLDRRPGLNDANVVIRPGRPGQPPVAGAEDLFVNNIPVRDFDAIIRRGLIQTYQNLGMDEAAATAAATREVAGNEVANLEAAMLNPDILIRGVVGEPGVDARNRPITVFRDLTPAEMANITAGCTYICEGLDDCDPDCTYDCDCPTVSILDIATHIQFETRLMPILAPRARPMSARGVMNLCLTLYGRALQPATFGVDLRPNNRLAAAVAIDGAVEGTPFRPVAGQTITLTVTPTDATHVANAAFNIVIPGNPAVEVTISDEVGANGVRTATFVMPERSIRINILGAFVAPPEPETGE